MVDELGKGQAVAQAVVTPQETYDPSRTPLVVSLFKPDGTPFPAFTAAFLIFATSPSGAFCVFLPAGLTEYLPTWNPNSFFSSSAGSWD